MGIFKEDCYGVQCDGCNEVYEDSFTGYAIFVERNEATENADDDGWRGIRGKWYCPECVKKLFHYDEELDEYVPNKKKNE